MIEYEDDYWDEGDEGEDGREEVDREYDAEWLDPADVPILDAMRDDDVYEPAQLEDSDVCRARHASYRCRKLAERGLLSRPMPGVYDLTDLGRRFLDGDLEPEEREALDVDD